MTPADCTGSGLSISLYTDLQEVHIGDTISYSVNIFNGLNSGPIVCDATEIQASLTTPDGIVHPIALSRTTMMNGESDTYANVVTYITRSQDVQADGTLKAVASDTGSIHQNDTNSLGGGNQGLNVRFLVADIPVPPTVIPEVPTGGGGGGGGRCVNCGGSSTTTITTTATTTTIATSTPNIPVLIPIIPKAGFAPIEKRNLWNIIIDFFLNHSLLGMNY